MQEHILREHQTLLKRMRRIERELSNELTDKNHGSFLSILRSLQFGWLTPGKSVLKLMETRKVSRVTVLSQPDLLQRKWFSELDEIDKGKWLLRFANRIRNDNIQGLAEIYGLTPRRLQQLLKLAKSASS